ncbi:hypothetical protein Bbelb_373760 [Branchiostoma belcheri]|nr:hypothetical protein Bbelb_373760 [Branchiostoma belcheri]
MAAGLNLQPQITDGQLALDLSNQGLTSIPEEVFDITDLEALNVSNNILTTCKLQHLDVSGNPLTYPPQKVCEEGAEAILSFLKEEAVKDYEKKKMLQAFNRLSLKVRQTELKPIARSLGLEENEIDTIKTSAPDDLPDQVYQTLVKWREKEGEGATLPELEKHLKDLGLDQLAEGLLGSPRSPENRQPFKSAEERGAFGGEDATRPQSSKYPSVTVDDKFPIIEFEQLDFPPDCYLGHGGFAAVARAHHLDWKHDVAVKRLLAHGSEQQLLYSEARKLKLASTSPYVVSLLGVCLEPHFAIVMPYMENGSLARLLRDVDVPWALRWRMAHEISLGMTFLHYQNPQILHCDLKAENVLLDDNFHVKISDFGLSKWRTESRIVTETSPTGATITHAPPEYILDINAVPTDKLDVYSFGVLLWEIITRREPYENTMNSALIEVGVRTGQRPDMRLVPTDVPDLDTVSQLMQKCWSQEQDHRPSFKVCEDQLRVVKNNFSKEDILEAIIFVQKEKVKKFL